MREFLEPTRFIDSRDAGVMAFARTAVGRARKPSTRAVRLYYAVRDRVRYDPYLLSRDPDTYRASAVIEAGTAYCIPKAVLLCAAARATGIPAALGFADVRNHLNTERLRNLIGTDLFTYHGYAALHLDDRWVKVTPAFNIELCERFGVLPLDFDGARDAMLHPYDRDNRRHMEYVTDHGLFSDLPFERIMAAFTECYPGLFERLEQIAAGRFEDERPLD